jgi:uroporphyrin-3 C-methyltransferase
LQVNTEKSEIDSESPESNPENPPEEKPETPPEDPPEATLEVAPPRETGSGASETRRGGGALPLLAFVFSVAALAVAGWMWWQDQAGVEQQEQRVVAELSRLDGRNDELSLKLNQVRDEVNSLAAGDVGAEFRAMQSRLETDRKKLDATEASINQQLEMSRSLQAAARSMQGRLVAAEGALAGLTTRDMNASSELDIAEVDYLLRLANERLKLFYDPVAAEQALEVADMHLDALDNPMYLGVRQEIAAARRSLSDIDMPDYLQIANELDDIQGLLASLPFQGEDPPAATATEAEAEGWWEKLKGVFGGLVTVRRSTDEENQRVSLQDKDLIRQRVWLQLEIAHLALMRRDQEAFRNSLARAEESIASWFDSGDGNYSTVTQGISKLKAVEIRVDVPDITPPWSTLRMLRSSQSQPIVAPQQAQQPATDLPVEQEDLE